MVFTACWVFACALIFVSYRVNRRLAGDSFSVDAYRVALTASAVLLLAILAESLVNPLYEYSTGAKLWEYRVLPLHDRNVSALAVVMWTAYGIHLYFMLQSLEKRLPARWNNRCGKAFVIGFEAPLFAEVSGNLVFLALADQYYAYYLPADVGHLTSFQVVPIYMLCIFIGLGVLRALERLPRRVELPSALFAGGIAWLLLG